MDIRRYLPAISKRNKELEVSPGTEYRYAAKSAEFKRCSATLKTSNSGSVELIGRRISGGPQDHLLLKGGS